MNKAWILYICFYNVLDVLKHSAVLPAVVCVHKRTQTGSL